MTRGADKLWDVIVVGGANTDFLVRGPRLPRPGETIAGTVFRQAPGGKGANQAVAAARLGARVALIARVGADPRGDDILEQLRAEKVQTHRATRDQEVATGVALVQVEYGGQKQILTAAGANQRLSVDDVQEAREEIQSSKLLLTQLEVSLEVVKAAVEIARRVGALVYLDPSPAVALTEDLYEGLDLIKPDQTEAETLTGVHVYDVDSAREAAHWLLNHGARAVAVETGRQGNLIVTPNEEHLLSLLPVESVDATGAGDAFIATLAIARLEGRSWQQAGEIASAAAALTTTRVGAQAALPTREEIFALLKEQGVRV